MSCVQVQPPSFSAITLKLKHIYVKTDEDDGVFFFDVFFHDYPSCSRLEVTHPRLAWITNGCLIEVNTVRLSHIVRYVLWSHIHVCIAAVTFSIFAARRVPEGPE